MRRAVPRSAALLALSLGLLGVAQAYEAGDEVTAFTLRDGQGKEHRLAALRGKKHVVLVVWSSRCPHSQAYAERLEALREELADEDVVLLLVAPGKHETAEGVEAARKKAKLGAPVLLDPGGKVSKDLGAVTTPTAYFIDKDGRLRYQGAIDDDPQGKKEEREEHLADAVNAVLAGEEPPKTKVKAAGFKIKY